MYLKNIAIYLSFSIGTIRGMEIDQATNQHLLKCYAAIKQNNVAALREMLMQNDFYKNHIAQIFSVPELEIFGGPNDNPPANHAGSQQDYFLRTTEEDLLDIALRINRLECAKLIADLQGKMRQQEFNDLRSQGKSEQEAATAANEKYINYSYLQSLLDYSNLSNQKVFDLTRTLIDNNLATANTIIDWIYDDNDDGQPIKIFTPLSMVTNAEQAEYLIKKGAYTHVTQSLIEQFRGEYASNTTKITLLPILNCIEKNIEPAEKQKILLYLHNNGAHIHRKFIYWASHHNHHNDAKFLLDCIDKQLSPKAAKKYPFIQQYPRLALISKSFAIDPFKYSDHLNHEQFTHANTTELIRHRELVGTRNKYKNYQTKYVIDKKRKKPDFDYLDFIPSFQFSSSSDSDD